jgi:hypothetical protein
MDICGKDVLIYGEMQSPFLDLMHAWGPSFVLCFNAKLLRRPSPGAKQEKAPHGSPMLQNIHQPPPRQIARETFPFGEPKKTPI